MKTSFRRRTALAVVVVLLLAQLPAATATPKDPRAVASAATARAPRGLTLPAPARITPPPLVRAPKRSEIPALARTHEGGGTRNGPGVTATVHDSKHAPPDPHAQSSQRRSMSSPVLSVPIGRAVPGRSVPAGPARAGRRSSSVMGGSGCNATPSDLPVLNGTDPGTGINPWWRYAEGTIPGVGRYMVNVATQNLLVQGDDMDVRNAGIDLAFRRTYNSLSLHDASSTDGATPSTVGNGWTSTFDAHVSGNAAGGLTVSDIDGARYDYTADGQGRWLPPAGQHASLVTYDGGATYQWTKKSGSTYIFVGPSINHGNTYEGYNGRLLKISGRNSNTYIALTYLWQCGDSASNENLAEIDASTQSGVTAKLYFANFGGHQLLSRLLWPDGVTTVTYSYDAAGNLVAVQKPAPNNSGGTTYESYMWSSNWLVMTSPRFNDTGGADGGYIAVNFGSPARTVAGIQGVGVMNFTPPDGTNTALQPNVATGQMQYSWTAVHNSAPGINEFIDTDGHDSYCYFDGSNRVTQVAEWTGVLWLATWDSWDASNNLTVSQDARGNVTNFAYDANGNAIAVGEPYTTTSQGSFKPTKLYDYDAFNNVVAYCDGNETHLAGADWTQGFTSQSDSLCATQAAGVPHWRATLTYPSSEPFGQLTSMTTPLGYARSFSYAPAQQAGNDYGLPTSVTGSSFAQLDGSTMSPTQIFWYDPSGNLRCYSKGRGTSVLSYDALGRVTSVSDPDDSSANGSSVCGKNTGQPGWNTQTIYTYYANGAKHTSQTPSERAFGVATTYSYDLDGDVATETAHHGCVPNQGCPDGTTQKWYDGADRLVEVALPMDPRTYSDGSLTHFDSGNWLTRYWYDLSGGGSVSVTASAPFHAYGNLYKTLVARGTSWLDKSGSQFDALDREVAKYSWDIPTQNTSGTYTNTLETTQLWYDGGPTTLGLLAQKTNPRGESVAYAYDEHGKVLTETYSGDAGRTANETYLYDANGRAASVTSSQFGAQLNTYDADGRLARVTEPTGGGVTDPAQIGYSYYPDGKRSAVSVTSPTFTQSNAIAYSYRVDGLLQTQSLNAFANASWLKTYTDAGRVNSVGGVDSQQRTYDAAGQLQRHTIRGANIDYTHDPEGSPLTQYVPMPGPSGSDQGQLLTNTYNVRGEVADTIYTPNSAGRYAHHRSTSWGGCITRSTVPMDASSQPDPPTMDSRSCATVFTGTMGSVDYNTSTFPNGSTSAFAFDTAGRMTRSVTTTSTFAAPDTTGTGNKQGGYSAGAAITTVVTTDTLFDAENHTVSSHPVVVRTRTLPDQPSSSTTTTTDTGSTTLGWGPNGHPLVVNAANQPGVSQMTLHWDGDIILFITDASGNVVDFKAGLDGEIAPRDPNQSALVTYERDIAGLIIGSSVNGTTSLAPLDAWDGTGPNFGRLNYAQYVRPDGFKIGGSDGGLGIPGIQINGVRAFDPALGSWTTPDAFEGDIHDPASQQKYMWNRGNPVDYSDPTGYCVPACVAIPAGAEVVVGGALVVAGLAYLSGNSDFGDKSMDAARAVQSKINDAVQAAGNAIGNAVNEARGHTTNRSKSNLPKHEGGNARRDQDYAGEKGDARRGDPRKSDHDDHKGPWPPPKDTKCPTCKARISGQ